MVSLERRQWLRFGPNLVMLIFLNGVAVLALAGTGASGNDPLGTAYLILPMLSAVGVGALGPTRRVLWLYRMTGRPLAWVVPKMLAVCSVWAVVVVGYGAALALLGQWTWHDLAWMLPISLAELLVAMAVGVLLPVTADQSISGSISEAAALVSVIVLAAGFQSALAGVDSLWWALALQVAAIGLAALGYGLVSVRAARRDDDCSGAVARLPQTRPDHGGVVVRHRNPGGLGRRRPGHPARGRRLGGAGGGDGTSGSRGRTPVARPPVGRPDAARLRTSWRACRSTLPALHRSTVRRWPWSARWCAQRCRSASWP